MAEKRCSKCGEVKDTSKFYLRLGHSDRLRSQCRRCMRESCATYRATPYGQEKHRKSNEKYRESDQGKEMRQQYHEEYKETDHYKELRRQYHEKYKAQHPEKISAKRIIGHAIRDGKIERRPCEVCGTTPADGHHDDYSKPLDVRWLCRKHHKQHHRKPTRE